MSNLTNVKLNTNLIKNSTGDIEKIQESYYDYLGAISKNLEIVANKLAQSVHFKSWQDLKSKPEYDYEIVIEQNNDDILKNRYEVKLLKKIDSERLEFSTFNNKFPEIKIDINKL